MSSSFTLATSALSSFSSGLFGTETVPGGLAFPAGTTLSLPSDGSAMAVLSIFESAALDGTLNATTDAAMALAVPGDINALLVESGNPVYVPSGYQQIADLSTGAAPTIFTSGNTAATVLGGLSGMTVWDNSVNETVYTGGGDNVIGMSSTAMEILLTDLTGANDVVAVGVGDASVTGGGVSNTIWGSGKSTLSNLNVNLVHGSSTVMAGIGTNTIDLGGTNDVIFGGGGSNNDTITGANDIYVAGSGLSTVTAGASDVVFGGYGDMDATIGGTGAIFVGGTGNDTINASTGVTGWGGSGTMDFISSGNTTIIGASGATTVFQVGGTGNYFNNGAGVMTVNGGTNSTGGTIIERWAGSGGIFVDASSSMNDTIDLTEGNTTVAAGTAPVAIDGYNTINYYGDASGSITVGEYDSINIASSGNVSVNDSNISANNPSGAESGHTLINAQNATGTVDITFSVYGDTVHGGAGDNIYTPFAPTGPGVQSSESVNFGTGTNNLVLNPDNTTAKTTLSVYDFNPNRDFIDFSGLGSTTLAQEAAAMAEQNLVMPNGQDKASTYFTVNQLTVNLYAGSSPSSSTQIPSIVSSHFITT